MNELIDQIEKASAPDRSMDRAIYEAVQLDVDMLKFDAESWFCSIDGGSYGFNTKHGNPAVHWCGALPHYTGSVDAAMTLATDDQTIYFTRPTTNQPYESQHKTYACVAPPGLGGPQNTKRRRHLIAYHAIPAMALCVAALRARTYQQQPPEK